MFSSASAALRRQAPAPATALARRTAAAQLRLASSSSSADSAANKAQNAAQQAGAQAQQVLAGAQKTIGNLLGSYKEPVFYNAAVAREVAKQVYVAEKLTPPSFAEASYTFRQFARDAPHVSFWRKLYESGEYKRWLIYAVEAYGIFKIGEMIGRRHVVGYKLDESRTHALT
ncbi:hypothetical protein JCM8202_001548 [Rhodotorula sphaerocarpa]